MLNFKKYNLHVNFDIYFYILIMLICQVVLECIQQMELVFEYLHTNYVDLSGGVRMHSADVISIRVQGIILSGLSGSRFITMRVAYESYYYDEINSLITDENI